jgi:hypothetical protein
LTPSIPASTVPIPQTTPRLVRVARGGEEPCTKLKVNSPDRRMAAVFDEVGMRRVGIWTASTRCIARMDHGWIMGGSWMDHGWIMHGSCMDHAWIMGSSFVSPPCHPGAARFPRVMHRSSGSVRPRDHEIRRPRDQETTRPIRRVERDDGNTQRASVSRLR